MLMTVAFEPLTVVSPKGRLTRVVEVLLLFDEGRGLEEDSLMRE